MEVMFIMLFSLWFTDVCYCSLHRIFIQIQKGIVLYFANSFDPQSLLYAMAELLNTT